MAGYETVFADFVELLGAIKTRAVVAPLLKQWLDYDVVGLPKASEIRAASGEAIPLEDVHRAIQDDLERRYDFYQHKMACWHWDSYAQRRYQEYLDAGGRPAMP